MNAYTDDLIAFIDASPTAFHAAAEAARRLREAGFTRLDERDPWELSPGRSYFVMRQDSSVVAFRIGNENPVEAGVRITAAHTDSPSFRIKVGSESLKAGAIRVTAEVYGGPIRNTWLDRELSLAGRVMTLREGKRAAELFDAGEPWALIPNVAIHLNRDVNKGVELNVQNEMRAVLTTGVSDDAAAKGYVRQLLAGKLDLSVELIGDYDVFLYPTERGRYVGPGSDMFVSGRIDNLGMSHAVVESLIAAESGSTVFGVLFDSEEIGSMTFQGANSSFLRDILKRAIGLSGEEDFLRTLASSSMISGDAAHAVHPNYADKHDESFLPELNGGPVVKIHAGQRYTTTAGSSTAFIDLCKRHDIPVQKFIGRSDIPSGGTIGPVTSSLLGIESIDVGNPIWGMHSARETGGAKDQEYMIKAITAYYDDGF